MIILINSLIGLLLSFSILVHHFAFSAKDADDDLQKGIELYAEHILKPSLEEAIKLEEKYKDDPKKLLELIVKEEYKDDPKRLKKELKVLEEQSAIDESRKKAFENAKKH